MPQQRFDAAASPECNWVLERAAGTPW